MPAAPGCSAFSRRSRRRLMLRSWLDIQAIACVVLVALALGCASLGDEDAAERISAADESRARAHQSVGANHLREGRVALAIRELRASEELNPDDRWTQLTLAEAYRQKGLNADAETHLRRRSRSTRPSRRRGSRCPASTSRLERYPEAIAARADPDRRSDLPAAVDRAHQQGLGADAAEAARRGARGARGPRSTTTTATGEPTSTSASSNRRKASASMRSSASSECSSSSPARSAPPRRTSASPRSTSRSAIASRLSNIWWPRRHSGRAVHGESDRRTT